MHQRSLKSNKSNKNLINSIMKVIVIAILTQPIFSQDFNCPQLKITNIADDDWNAVLLLSSHVDVTGLSNVEVTFDRVTQFVTVNKVL